MEKAVPSCSSVVRPHRPVRLAGGFVHGVPRRGCQMFIRLTTFPLERGVRAQVHPIADKFRQILAGQPGFHSATFCFSDGDTEFVSLSQWDSRAHAVAATANVRDAAQAELAALLRGVPSTTIMEVYESAS